MGFFSDLKEDLSQAVNEMTPEEKVQETKDTVEMAEVVETAPETSEDLSKMLEQMNLDSLIGEQEEKQEEKTVEIPLQAVPEDRLKEKKPDRMFAGSAMSHPVADETAVITAGMTIKGDISSQGSVDIIGDIIGNIDIMGKLNVTGSINGNSKSAEFYAEKARINGEVHSEGSLKIGQNSIIIGNIFGSSAVIAGAVKGDIDVHGPVVLDTSAIVMGNIKSRSVQINNGAVIEGLCSQCYAEVNPTSFFDNIKKVKK